MGILLLHLLLFIYERVKVKKSRRKGTRKVGRDGLVGNCIGKGLDEGRGEFVEEGLK